MIEQTLIENKQIQEKTLEENSNLTDVVVVGYGTQKVTKVSGAISTVKSADIQKLNPVRFQRIGDTDRKFHHGFIAQEVGEALQELGYTSNDFAGFDDRNPDHLALMYDQFIPVIINAIQEEEQEMVLLKQRVKQLEDILNGGL
jgi:hypothetical protein